MFIQPFKKVSLLAMFLIILSACSLDNKSEPVASKQSNSVNIDTSLWLVDWAFEESINEALETIENIDNILLFATYFDESEELYETENTKQLIDKVVRNPIFNEKNVYITIVNDQFKDDGTIIQKNPELLQKFLSTASNRAAHIEQIIEYVQKYPVDGIEIDYEKIPSNLISEFFLFALDLQSALKDENLSLRVILEPSFPVETYPLLEELQYVVMAYNLYGSHSGPGPKADYAFLDSLVEKFPNDFGNVDIALATGGFSWKNDKVQQLTDEQILDLIQAYNLEPIRDVESGALSFVYQENGIDIEVWYADATTITLWVERLMKNEIYTGLSIWRSGGLTKEMLDIFDNLESIRTQYPMGEK